MTAVPRIVFIGIVCLSMIGGVACGQLKKQISTEPPAVMSQAELDELGDPIFELFLKNSSDKTELQSMEEAIQPNAGKRRLFVVSERIINENREGSRRGVIAFEGTNSGIPLSSNAMLSVIFSSDDFVDGFIEAWGWDESRRRYNYYRLDSEAGLSWKFKGSSANKELFGKQGTCFACHLNGAPIMKELLIPWNNWHSRSSQIPYFSKLQPPANRWPIVDNSRFDGLSGAAQLDSLIRSSLKNFNATKIDAAKADGVLKDGKGLLRHLFVTTEFNMISAKQKSNLHSLSSTPLSQPSLDVVIPGSFFLNSAIIAGGGDAGFGGLGVVDAGKFQSIKVSPQEYETLVDEFSLVIDGKPGDADFAWLIPEPSDIDNDMIDRLMATTTVPAHYVAAVMAIDVRNPLLSAERQSLLDFVPDEFALSQPANIGDRLDLAWFQAHDLTKQTIAKLQAANITENAAAQDFLAILTLSDGKTPLETLQTRVEQYAADINGKLAGNDRDDELKRLFEIALELRKLVLNHPQFGNLDETGGKLLFPLQRN